MTARLFLTTALVLGASPLVLAQGSLGQAQDKYGHGTGAEKVLYIWAQDQAHVAPDFLAVIDFDEASSKYGQSSTSYRCHLRAISATNHTTVT